MPISVNIGYDIGVVGCVVVISSGQVCSVVVGVLIAIVGVVVRVRVRVRVLPIVRS